MRLAEAGIGELQRFVDTLIVIPNQNLFRVANERTTFSEAFAMADQVLHSGVRSITDLMVLPGLINLDFADVRTVMTEMGKAMMGTGEASGESRALMAAENAIKNPLLDEVSLKGAKAVLVNITGGDDMTLLEVDEAANAISGQVDPDANIIFGAAFDAALEGVIRVSVVATGMDGASISAIEPVEDMRARAARPAAEAKRETAPARAVAAAPAAPPEPARPPLTVVQSTAGQNGPRFEPPGGARPAAPPEVKRIVDPLAAEPRDLPLFPGMPRPEAPRQRRGILSLFGQSRRDVRPAPMSGGSGPQPAYDLTEEPDLGTAKELEIPSFLRRLAN